MFWGKWSKCVLRVKNKVIMQLQQDYAPFVLRMHCKVHWCNLVMQTLSKLHSIATLIQLMQTLYGYFSKSPKRHLEFTKPTQNMETKGNKILCIVKRHVGSPFYHLWNESFILTLVTFNKDAFRFIHCPLGFFAKYITSFLFKKKPCGKYKGKSGGKMLPIAINNMSMAMW